MRAQIDSLPENAKPSTAFHHAEFVSGFFAMLAMLAVMFIGRLTIRTPFVPEQIADRLFALLPISLIEIGVQALGLYAKKLAFVGCVLLFLASGAYSAGWVLRALGDVPERPVQFGVFLYAVIFWYVSLSLVIPGFAIGVFTGLPIQTGVPALALLVVYVGHAAVLGPILKWFTGEEGGERRKIFAGRRTILTSIGLTAVASFLYTFVGKFGTEIRRGASARLSVGTGIFPNLPGLTMEVTPTADFYHVSKNIVDPDLDGSKWALEIRGLVARPMVITYGDLKKLEPDEQYATLMCISNPVGGDLIGNARWKGVRLASLLKASGVQSSATDVILRAADGYSDSIPIDRAPQEGTLLCYEMNGEPLTPTHGLPVRLLVPGIYGMKNVKWITQIELVDYDYKGFWQDRGWDDKAEYLTTSRIDIPPPRTSLARPTIAGIAFAGDRQISQVEVSTNAGATWAQAELRSPLSPYSWVLWQYAWLPHQIGKYELQVRATDGRGETQTAQPADPIPRGASGYHKRSVRLDWPSSRGASV